MVYAEIIGRATADAVEKVSENGKVLRSFSVATDRGYGEQKTTDFMPCVIFAPKLDNGWKHITKGKNLYIRGHLASYPDRDNPKVTRWQMIVESLDFVNSGKREGDTQYKPQGNPKAPENFDDDIDF